MKLVVGLGNPGKRYAETRHNLGFMVVQKLVPMVAASGFKDRFDGEYADAMVDGVKVGLLCPTTFMNASGRSVRKAVDFLRLVPEEVLVIVDCLSLPLGQLRIRGGGSSGGQKGLGDILRHLGTEDVPRLRIGIDPAPPGWDVADYVLSTFRPSERAVINQALESAAHAACLWVTAGLEACMNAYNGKQK